MQGKAESPYAWTRLATAVLLCTIGGVGIRSVVVVLPAVQAELGLARAEASLPYTATMVGFGLGGILMGRLADRFGVMVPVVAGTIVLGLGYIGAGAASSLGLFALAQGVLIGLLGSSASLGPLLADISLWFTRRRGIAVAICASGSYLAGAVWPPIEYFSPREAGARVGTVLMATLLGMALGGWMSGALFDLTGSYRAAFLNGIAWNLLNLAIAALLLRRATGGGAPQPT
jgi:MFS family permease